MKQAMAMDWNAHFAEANLPLRLDPLGSAQDYWSSAGAREYPALARIGRAQTGAAVLLWVYEARDSSRLRELLSSKRAEWKENTLLLSPEIRPLQAEWLRERGISFIDARGNCSIHLPGVDVEVRGRNVPSKNRLTSGSSSPRSFALFSPRRAQVSAMLLSYPVLLRASMREIGKAAHVATGTTATALKLLVDAGYLRSGEGRYYFDNAEAFLDEWARAYATGLGRQLLRFRGVGKGEAISHSEPVGWVSGEVAAGVLLSGGNSTQIYTPSDKETRQLIRTGRLRKVEGEQKSATANPGTIVTVSEAFWGGPEWQQLELDVPSPSFREGAWKNWLAAPLAIIYADLVSHVDPRVNETAGVIKVAMQRR